MVFVAQHASLAFEMLENQTIFFLKFSVLNAFVLLFVKIVTSFAEQANAFLRVIDFLTVWNVVKFVTSVL